MQSVAPNLTEREGGPENVLSQAKAGDPLAFEAIVQEQAAMVFSLAYRFLRSRAHAEDLAQDVFLALHQHLSQMQSPAHLVHWLRKVTSHRCIDATRSFRYRLERLVGRVPELTIVGKDADPLLAELLHRIVGELAARPRMVMTLRYQEDLDVQEIAALLDVPVNTVKSDLRRSLDVLRRKLAKYGYHDET